MKTQGLKDKPLIQELVSDALRQIHSERGGFTLSVEHVLAFLNVEYQKENEKQVRELLKQRSGRRHGVLPELRELLDEVAEEIAQ